MSVGWFDAFRDDLAPSNFANLIHPSFNVRTLFILLIFIVPYLAFLLVLPGVRERRLASFVTITLHLLIGILVIASIRLPYWTVGDVVMQSQLRTQTTAWHEARVGLRVGLRSLNISLKFEEPEQGQRAVNLNDVFINEEFTLDGVQAMSTEVMNAFRGGLPYPILKVLEYFILQDGAFDWGLKSRQAGHYTASVVWTGFALWLWQTLFLAFVPHHYGKVGILCGIALLIGNLIYGVMCPSSPNIPFVGSDKETVFLRTAFGASFYLTLAAGIISIVFGVVLTIFQYVRLYSLGTIFSATIDDTVGPKCKFGRPEGQHHFCCGPPQADVVSLHHLDVKRSIPASSSGFQSNASFRSSAKSILSSLNSDRLNRSLSTESVAHSPFNEEDLRHEDQFVQRY